MKNPKNKWIIKTMSTTQKDNTTQKEDPVVAYLKQYCEDNRHSHVGKFLLYADPNGSGFKDSSSLQTIIDKCRNMNPDEVFDPSGTERPLTSVSIILRVRHTINELLNLYSLVDLMKSYLIVGKLRDEKWPREGLPTVNIKTLLSMRVMIVNALTKELPSVIDDMYQAKYKNTGAFTYSLSETKFYGMRNEFMVAAFDWIGSLDDMKGRGKEGEILKSRHELIYDSWFKVEEKASGNKYPPLYEKMVKAICAKVGKLKYDGPTSLVEAERKMVPEVNKFLDFLRAKDEHGIEIFNQDDFYLKRTDNSGKVIPPDHTKVPDLKKKSFQSKLYSALMERILIRSRGLAGLASLDDNKPIITAMTSIYDELMKPYITYATSFGIDHSHILADTLREFFDKKRYNFTRAKFEMIKSAFTQTGICNRRLMNAIAKFISSHSLYGSNDPRKIIPPRIEQSIVMHGDLSKIKISSSSTPNIIFSKEAVNMIGSSDIRNLYDSYLNNGQQPVRTGYLQRGIMSIISALTTQSEPKNVPRPIDVNGMVLSDVKLLKWANEFSEMAKLYSSIIKVTTDQRAANEKIGKKNDKMVDKLQKRQIIMPNQIPPPQALMTQSPDGTYRNVASSPAVGSQSTTIMGGASPSFQGTGLIGGGASPSTQGTGFIGGGVSPMTDRYAPSVFGVGQQPVRSAGMISIPGVVQGVRAANFLQQNVGQQGIPPQQQSVVTSTTPFGQQQPSTGVSFTQPVVTSTQQPRSNMSFRTAVNGLRTVNGLALPPTANQSTTPLQQQIQSGSPVSSPKESSRSASRSSSPSKTVSPVNKEGNFSSPVSSSTTLNTADIEFDQAYEKKSQFEESNPQVVIGGASPSREMRSGVFDDETGDYVKSSPQSVRSTSSAQIDNANEVKIVRDNDESEDDFDAFSY